MKVIRKNVLYIDENDVRYMFDSFPKWIDNNFKEMDGIIKIEDQETIDYFNSKEEIIDYDKVKYLSDEGLDEKIDKNIKKLYKFSDLWGSRYTENKRTVDEIIKKTQYKIKTLERYKENRDEYDKKIKRVTNNKSLLLIKELK